MVRVEIRVRLRAGDRVTLWVSFRIVSRLACHNLKDTYNKSPGWFWDWFGITLP